jgi:large subunit ribosomal protein L18
MGKKSRKVESFERRRKRVRRKIEGTAEYPRLSVRRSLKHIYAQVIDDQSGRTLASSSSVSLKISGANVASAKEVGKSLAEAALKNNVKTVRFDRNGRLYHGRLKALADAAREAGLKI